MDQREGIRAPHLLAKAGLNLPFLRGRVSGVVCELTDAAKKCQDSAKRRLARWRNWLHVFTRKNIYAFSVSKAPKGLFMNTLITANPIEAKTECLDTRFLQHDAAGCKLPVNTPQILNILVAVDFSDHSEVALRYAGFLAESFGATLTLVNSVEPYVYPEDLSAGLTIEEINVRWMQKQKEKLEAVRQTIKEGIPATVVVTVGTPWNRIIEAAKSWNADLIVMGTHPSPVKHVLLGSTAERVVRHAVCPVLVVPAGPTVNRV